MDAEKIFNKIVEIPSTTTSFIGGVGIPQWARREGALYVSRVNENGTIALSYTRNMLEVGTVRGDDVIITDNDRATHDSMPPEFPDIDIRIMGVPKRIDHVRYLQKRLGIPYENVFIDEERKGCVWNAKRAWLKETDKKYVMVIQDDIELCNDFPYYLNKIVATHPADVISLYCPYFTYRFKFSKDICRESPYITSPSLSGQALLMKSELVHDCVNSWGKDARGDDASIQFYFYKKGVESFLTTVPFIIQHVGDKSVHDPARSMGRSEFYDADPSWVKWDSGIINDYHAF